MKRSTTIIVAAVLVAVFAVYGCAPRVYHGARKPGSNYHPLITSNSPFSSVSDSLKFKIWVLNKSEFKHCWVNIQDNTFMRTQEFFDFAPGDTTPYPDKFWPNEDDLTVTIRFPCDDCVDSLGWHTVTRQFPISGLAPPQYLLVLTNEMLMWSKEKQPGQVTMTRNLDLLVNDSLNNWYTLKRFATHYYHNEVISGEFWVLCQPMSGVDRDGHPAIPVKKVAKIDKLRQHLRRDPNGVLRFYGWFIDIGDLPEEWFPYSTPPAAK